MSEVSRWVERFTRVTAERPQCVEPRSGAVIAHVGNTGTLVMDKVELDAAEARGLAVWIQDVYTAGV